MATYIWSGDGQSGRFDDPANWSVGGSAASTAPTSTDDVVIPKGATVALAYADGSGTASLNYASLTVQAGANLDLPYWGNVTINTPVVDNGQIAAGTAHVTFSQDVTGKGT